MELVTQSPLTRRAVCDRCERPEKVCLCAHLPPTPSRCDCLKDTKCIIVQHPLERKQKHRTDWLAQKCFDVDLIVSRRPEKLPEDCVLVFPLGAKETLTSCDVPRTLLFLDATWKCAKEMAASDTFRLLPRVALDIPTDIRPEFLVRKPETFVSEGESVLGFSTAEAIGLALDTLAVRRNIKHEELVHTHRIQRVIRAYVDMQLQYTVKPKHRPERLRYVPNLYSNGGQSESSKDMTESAQKKRAVETEVCS